MPGLMVATAAATVPNQAATRLHVGLTVTVRDASYECR
jgi:hypothetical protein